MTSEVVRTTLGHVWKALGSFGCDRALMGGVALATWNHPRATRDIDLLVSVDRNDVDRLVSRMRTNGFRPKKHPPLLVVGEHGFIPFLYTPPGEFYDVQLDLMLAEGELQKSAMQRRVTRVVPGIDGSVDVLSCEDLILFKLVAGRMIDRADAAFLLRENEETLDLGYLGVWLSRLDMKAEFQEIWLEAFPGKPLPA